MEAAAPYMEYIPYIATVVDVDVAAAAYDLQQGDYDTAENELIDAVVTGVISTVAPGIDGAIVVAVYTGIGGSERF